MLLRESVDPLWMRFPSLSFRKRSLASPNLVRSGSLALLLLTFIPASTLSLKILLLTLYFNLLTRLDTTRVRSDTVLFRSSSLYLESDWLIVRIRNLKRTLDELSQRTFRMIEKIVVIS